MGKTAFGLMAALGLAALLLATAPARAQAPTSVNPTAQSVQERDLLDKLNPGNPTVRGFVSIPDAKAGTLIQPAGRDWREFHQVTLPRLGAAIILGMVILLAIFYTVRGRIRIASGRSERTITRFGALDRFAHWLTATSFVILALTGLNITFGRFVILPIIGPESFAAWSAFAKYLHNFLSFAFMAGVVLMFVLWVKDNLPSRLDIGWLKAGGGLVGTAHPPADRFNAGQKGVFWVVILSGAALSFTGILLLYPFYLPELPTTIGDMQLANVTHALVAVVAIAVILAHIYIGSIGMEGAFEAMGSGQVDLNWAKEHHSVWADKQAHEEPHRPGGATVPAE